MQRRTSPTQATAEQLREDVRRIREDGFAVSRDDVELGVTALSVPIRDHTGTTVAALSVSGLTAHLPDTEHEHQIGLLRAAAAEASRALGLRAGV